MEILPITIQDRRQEKCEKEASMVFFHNINPGARVQVKWRGEIESGTIRYAGSLVAKDGDWVGVELDNAVGNTSGLFKGIQYFHCRSGHGIFTHARNIRFPPSKRILHDTYKPVSKTSFVDESLFAKTEATPPIKSYWDPAIISHQYLNRVTKLIQGNVILCLIRLWLHVQQVHGWTRMYELLYSTFNTTITLLEQTALGLANKHTNRVFIRQRRLENCLAKFCMLRERTLPLDNVPPVTLLHSILLLLQFFMKILIEAHFFSLLCFIFLQFFIKKLSNYAHSHWSKTSMIVT